MSNFLFSINPTIMAAIIGALIGSISAWCLSYFTQEHRFNKKKNGAYLLLKSEIEINLSNLKSYKEMYLIKTSQELYEIGNLNDINAFYYYLREFPILNHNSWDKLMDVIPYVFEDSQISQIIQFNVKLDDLSKRAITLCENGMPKREYGGFYLFELDFRDYEDTLGVYKSFENNINGVINEGENILNSF